MARVPAFQAGCCEFESRLPLFLYLLNGILSETANLYVTRPTRNILSSILSEILPRTAHVVRLRCKRVSSSAFLLPENGGYDD